MWVRHLHKRASIHKRGVDPPEVESKSQVSGRKSCEAHKAFVFVSMTLVGRKVFIYMNIKLFSRQQRMSEIVGIQMKVKKVGCRWKTTELIP